MKPISLFQNPPYQDALLGKNFHSMLRYQVQDVNYEELKILYNSSDLLKVSFALDLAYP